MMKENFDDLRGLELVDIKKVSTYHISTVICLFFLLAMIVATFVIVILPLHKIVLTIAFIFGIIAGIYDIVLEFIVPERHLHWRFKVPEHYAGWKFLMLTAICIDYDPEENIITLQFADDIDSTLYNFISDMAKK